MSMALLYVIATKGPYDSEDQNDLEFFNEMTVLIALLQSLGCSEYTSTLPVKERARIHKLIGLNQMAVLGLLITVNYSLIMKVTVKK